MHILVLESIHQDGIDILLEANHTVELLLGLNRDELLTKLSDVDALIIKSVVNIDEVLLQHSPKLKVIGRAGVGTDNIDKNATGNRGITILTVPGGNSDAGADYTVMQILCMLRNAYQAQIMMESRDYRRDLLLGRDLCALNVGVVGLGNVGKKVIKRLKGFGCRIIAFDPYISDTDFLNLEIEKAHDINSLIREVDVLSLHVPLTAETRSMIGAEQLNIAKSNLVIVNTSRGAVIDEGALIEAVEQKKISAVALDVFDNEPPFDAFPGTEAYDNPLLHVDDICTTPHIGASTIDAQKNISINLANQIIDFFGKT